MWVGCCECDWMLSEISFLPDQYTDLAEVIIEFK